MPGMAPTVSTVDTAGAVLFIGWAVATWAAVAVLAVGNGRAVKPWLYKLAVGLVGVGVVGQVGHFQEHVTQAGYWIARPYALAWMTPWADSSARGMGQVDAGKPALGMEILHLVGNCIFVAGPVGIVQITHRVAGQLKARKFAGRFGPARVAALLGGDPPPGVECVLREPSYPRRWPSWRAMSMTGNQ